MGTSMHNDTGKTPSRKRLYIDADGVKRGYYVYAHKDCATGSVFYVGKGSENLGVKPTHFTHMTKLFAAARAMGPADFTADQRRHSFKTRGPVVRPGLL
jgi:hypothetical protein